jgi:proteasome assembly chaperone (PAC2) family protein
VALYELTDPGDLIAPVIVAAFDGWVDAGGAATSAAGQLAGDGDVLATFDADRLFDFRARRPTLEIRDGRLAELTWSELTLRRTTAGDRDVLVLAGAEPDFRWREFSADVVALAGRLGVAEWISLGTIPAAVPHTRPVPILGTASEPGRLRGVRPGPAGILRVPGAALSVVEMALTAAGTPAVGYFGQIPHYVSGPYPAAAIELLRAVGRHLDAEIDLGELEDEADKLRTRLNTAVAVDETTRTYVERLESMIDEERLPSGDELISQIERFLHDQGGESSQRP